MRFVDVPTKKPTLASGIRDALLRDSRRRGVKVPLDRLPQNRAEARRMMRGAGPWMRFRYEVGDDGVRRAVRVRL